MEHKWGGNVRELKNAVERVCIVGEMPFVDEPDLSAMAYCPVNSKNRQKIIINNRKFKDAVNDLKKRHIINVLEYASWNQTVAAKMLGIQRTYLSRLLNELRIRER